MIRKIITHLKFENHLTSWAVLFLLNLMSGKYILRMAEEGYRTQKNISLAFLRCIGVRVEFCASANEYPKIIFCLNKIFSVSCCRCQKWRHAHASRESFESISSKMIAQLAYFLISKSFSSISLVLIYLYFSNIQIRLFYNMV